MIIPTPDSRYVGTRLVNDADGRELYDIRNPMPFEPIVDSAPIILNGNDTLHHIAYEYYGDAQLWWAIADFNGIFDVTTELVKGKRIFVPTLDAIESYLTQDF